jgi:membrane fusion protein, multidrug efflux system
MKTQNQTGDTMNKFLLSLLLSSFLAAVTAPATADQRTSSSDKARRVVVAPVVQRSVPLRLEYIGNMKAWESAEIKARVTGYVLSYHFREGENVKQGQQLFSIDPRPFKAILDKAKAQLLKHQAELTYAREQVVRYRKLAKDEFISRDAYDGYRTSAAALKAQVAADRASIALARINLNYCSIDAPFSGRAGQRLIDPGNLVTASGGPSDPTLVVIKQINPIKILFAVPEKDLQRIRAANRPKTLSIEVIVPNDGNRLFSGELWLIDNRVDPATGMIEMEGKLPNQEGMLWPGQFVNVAIQIGTQSDTLTVPTAAIALGQRGPFLFTVSDDGITEMRLIGTGESAGNDTIVTHGLKAGERVVVEGQVGLQSGMHVKVGAP